MSTSALSATDQPELASQIEAQFNRLFGKAYNVVMEGGAVEPMFVPATQQMPARLSYRADFARSALHEAAHWCIASTARHRYVDFGYWYVDPSQRSDTEQRNFEAAERKPQALEACFCAALTLPFDVSLDNLAHSNYEHSVRRFRVEVKKEQLKLQSRLPGTRARLFLRALQHMRKLEIPGP